MGGTTAAQKTRTAKTTERGTRVKQQSQSAESAQPENQPQPIRHVRYRPRAAVDLESAVVYLGEVRQAPQAAKRLFDGITQALANLCAMPTMGKPFSDDNLDRKMYRTWLVGHHRIFYSFDDEWLTVWRIVHTSQDIDNYAIRPLEDVNG